LRISSRDSILDAGSMLMPAMNWVTPDEQPRSSPAALKLHPHALGSMQIRGGHVGNKKAALRGLSDRFLALGTKVA
jgi:hypothetical protein